MQPLCQKHVWFLCTFHRGVFCNALLTHSVWWRRRGFHAHTHRTWLSYVVFDVCTCRTCCGRRWRRRWYGTSTGRRRATRSATWWSGPRTSSRTSTTSARFSPTRSPPSSPRTGTSALSCGPFPISRIHLTSDLRTWTDLWEILKDWTCDPRKICLTQSR